MTDENKNQWPYATGQCRAKIPIPVVWILIEQVNHLSSLRFTFCSLNNLSKKVS